MVEQSMKIRSGVKGGSAGLRMLWKTVLTCEGSGRTVMIISWICGGKRLVALLSFAS